MNTRQSGKTGEEIAVRHLCENGYTVVSRNYQTRNGEIDCIARTADGVLVFIEVKKAERRGCGHPFSWIDRRKQKTIVQTARRYLAEHNMTDAPCRFDAIAIVDGELEHLENCFLA